MTSATSLPGGWTVCFKPNRQASQRLFCFPYAGGGASVFRTWQDGLPPSIEVWAVQPPGRESRLRESPFTRIPDLVGELAKALQSLLERNPGQGQMPFAFWGHSMGALVSFEFVRQLRRQGGPAPTQLFVSACRAPQLPNPDPPIHELPDDRFIEELRRLDGTPEAVLDNAELMRLFLPLLRADMAACETFVYAAEEPLACSISAFGGLQDRVVSRDALDCWRQQTRGAFKLRMFPGSHFFLHTAQPALLRAVAQDLLQPRPG